MASMFCNQCEQAVNGTGCLTSGACGKKPEVAALQDLLVFQLQELAPFTAALREKGAADREIDEFVVDALFSTVTNVAFDPSRIEGLIRRGHELKKRIMAQYEKAARDGTVTGMTGTGGPRTEWTPADTMEGLVRQGQEHDLRALHEDDDVSSAIQILLYGIKGMAAYAHHAMTLGKSDDEIVSFFHRALAATVAPGLGLMDYVGLCMECGKANLRAMELLNQAHIERYGKPEPTPVSLGTRAGKAILVSGHDLKMLEELLKQTEGTGINIYTHGEMLPAHAYPGLRKYRHLAGNFGGAWQDQAKEFAGFPGPIIFNTNCIQRPAESYKDRLFTWGLVAWPDVRHIDGWDFSEVIQKAGELPGFEDRPGREILVGFGHDAVLGVADRVVGAVKSGAIRRFFLIGGCDGAKPGRNYYTELAEKVPADCVILTLACGKYRFNKLDFGDIGGIPRLLDIGQCNDAYSAVRIALALADAFSCGVNDLPLSFILSWYEQKAVVILLTLLHLGIRNIKLGPSLPAFITPNVLSFLVEQFNIGPITTVEQDLAEALREPAEARK